MCGKMVIEKQLKTTEVGEGTDVVDRGEVRLKMPRDHFKGRQNGTNSEGGSDSLCVIFR